MKSLLFSPTLLLLLSVLLLLNPLEAGPFRKKQPAPLPTPIPFSSQVPLAVFPLAAEPTLPETVVTPEAISSPPSYALPYEGYRYQRSEGRKGFSLGTPKPSGEMLELLSVIRARTEQISKFGLPYVFGGDHPSEGGMDCSGSMQFLLSDIGFKDMPRTSYDQYAWLRKNRTMHHSKTIPERMGGRKGIKPGDLIFWGGTYNSGHKVSHVMIYLGQGGDGIHYMFGARGKSKQGLNGSGVDIFKLETGAQKGLIGFGSLPGVL